MHEISPAPPNPLKGNRFAQGFTGLSTSILLCTHKSVLNLYECNIKD